MKRSTSRFLSTLLVLCMVLALLPGTALAANSTYPVTGGNIYFDAATGAITDCDESVTEAIIPSEINGVAVTSIGELAFYNCRSLTSVVIPGGVTTIEEQAFYYCDSLTSVTIPNSVTSIGIDAFAYCKSLTSVTIPSSVTSISDTTFNGCYGLTDINVASGNSAYSAVDGVLFDADHMLLHTYPAGKSGAYTIPSSVTRIGESAFSFCANLTSVTIPSSVTSIGGYAFFNCISLTSVVIPSSVTTIEGNAFRGCESLASVTIPNSVTSIDYMVFAYCFGLTKVTIPDSVTSIGNGAFSQCFSLTDVYYSGSESQWKQISIDSTSLDGDTDENENEPLLNATKHYNSTGPDAPDAPKAVLSPQKLKVNGEEKACEKYNINDENYFKLRDLAYMLSGTGSQFSVDYDYASQLITIKTGQSYTPIGTELGDIADRSETVVDSFQEVFIDGEKVSLKAYNIGDYNFFRLRDLGPILNFEVDFDQDTNTAIVKSK